MKSTILHGDDQVKSRQRLNELILEAKANGWDVTRLDGGTISRGELLTAARSQGLLAQNQLIVIEDIFSSNSKAVDALPEFRNCDEISAVVWERKKIDGRKLMKFKKVFKIELFKIPQTVFTFLDSLAPGNASACLKLLKKVSAKEVEFLLYMLASRVRQLIWVKEEPKTVSLPGWQKARLAAQAKKWDATKLRQFHSELLDLDRQNKRSRLPENLSASLDLLVAEI